MIGGLTMLVFTISLFATEGKGTLAPWDPTQELVVSGPYRSCRNPMITGVLGILIGESLFFNQLFVLAWAALFFTINHLYFIFKEEPGLERRFGDDYRRYKEKVPRWGVRISEFGGD
jgi:protein-S-isoprenylcysteine O-methyltransferase Ste14